MRFRHHFSLTEHSVRAFDSNSERMEYNQAGLTQIPVSKECYAIRISGCSRNLYCPDFFCFRRGFGSERRLSVNRFRGEPNGCEGLGVVCRLRRLDCPSLDPDLSESSGKL